MANQNVKSQFDLFEEELSDADLMAVVGGNQEQILTVGKIGVAVDPTKPVSGTAGSVGVNGVDVAPDLSRPLSGPVKLTGTPEIAVA